VNKLECALYRLKACGCGCGSIHLVYMHPHDFTPLQQRGHSHFSWPVHYFIQHAFHKQKLKRNVVVKYLPGVNFKTFKEPRNRFQGINSACLWSLPGRYYNPFPTRFLVPIECLKIQALLTNTALRHWLPMVGTPYIFTRIDNDSSITFPQD
jgi:hypothetical protein